MSGAEEYELIVTPPVARALAEGRPEAVAAAVIELITTALVGEPRRVGKSLQRELSGIYSARRGTYRVLYRINQERREVIALRVEHRRDVYRSR